MTIINKNAKNVHFALEYAELGWHVLPIWSIKNGVCACWNGAECKNNWGKHPLYDKYLKVIHGVYDATTDSERIREIWEKHPYANIGIATGAKSGIFVLDIDAKSDGLKFLEDLKEQYYGGNLPDTVVAKTGSGGYHVLFKYPEWFSVRIKNNVGKIAEGVDIRTDGGLIVAPPSIHKSGGRYEWVEGHSPFEKQLAEIPEGLAELLRQVYKQELAKDREQYEGRVWPEYLEGPQIKEGTRDDSLFRIGCSMRSRGASYEDILKTLLEVNQKRCVPPMGEDEVQRKAEQAAKYEQGRNTDRKKYYPLTDAGNAERYADRHGMDVKYNRAFGWLVWDGTRWAIDDTGEVTRRAIETARAMKEEAKQIQPVTKEQEEYKESLEEYARKSESKNKLTAMLDLAKVMPGIAIRHEHFDTDPWLLNVKNGTINLKTMEFTEHRRENMITKVAMVDYDKDAKCPRWEQFLREIFADADGNPDEDLIEFVQRAAGYTLSGDTSEQVMFILHGGGKNGKSTFLNALHEMLGDYAQQAPSTLLSLKSWGDNGASSEVARINGSRFVTVVETAEGARLNEGLVKQLTGGDKVSARFLYKELFEFKPVAKFFMATNHKPMIRGADEGIWRRIRLIPFEVEIPPEKRDKHLDSKLREELPGILNWCLEGFRKWMVGGLTEPTKVSAATQAYRAEMDALGQFLDERCVLHQDAKVSPTALYQEYKEWCDENGEHIMTQRMLSKRLKERGFDQGRSGNMGRFWKGIGLASSHPGDWNWTAPAPSSKEVAVALHPEKVSESSGGLGLVAKRYGMMD